MHRLVLLAAALVVGASGALAQALRNAFDDPFFPLSAGVPECPEPAGPRMTDTERLAQSHRRAEKGTTCWLAGEAGCERASAYAYDREIAEAIRREFGADGRFADTTLWVTVQGRVVYVEGCVAREAQAGELEQRIRALPHVQQALAIVMLDPHGVPPYRRFDER